MPHAPFELTQMAVDIVGTSPHATNKIAAALSGKDADGKDFVISRTNFYPPAIEKAFGQEQKIGNASPTVHAEMAVLQAAPRTEGSAIAITDLFCPNCAKYMAEAGVKTIYIDHKGLDKDWANRNGEDFEDMSMRIVKHAGINVYVVNRKKEELTPIFESSSKYAPSIENPIYLEKYNGPAEIPAFMAFVAERKAFYKDRPFAAAFALGGLGNLYAIAADEHPSIGYTAKTLEEPEGKYSFTLQPLNRLMLAAKRHGLSLHRNFLYVSRTPTGRDLVNAVGADLTKFYIGDRERSRGPNSLAALEMLEGAKVIEIVP
ncbi:MAG TPA: deoxycytidylate deaminase [Rhodospirillaceae bacterium]|nr:deoxycytidylate deaminase [Rhodospirillaceae bacterium]